MENAFEDRLARRLRGLRSDASLTLDELAARSGVSRSTISLAERAESSPTAHSLDRLAAALGVTMASLFTEPDGDVDASPLARRTDQTIWRDPASGYRRRTLSPSGYASTIALAEIELKPGTEVALDDPSRPMRVDQQVWVLGGALEIDVGDVRHRLETGDCLAMDLDRPSRFRNPGSKTARYLVAIAAAAPATSRAGAAAAAATKVAGGRRTRRG